jgi:hypothetical protein
MKDFLERIFDMENTAIKDKSVLVDDEQLDELQRELANLADLCEFVYLGYTDIVDGDKLDVKHLKITFPSILNIVKVLAAQVSESSEKLRGGILA